MDWKFWGFVAGLCSFSVLILCVAISRDTAKCAQACEVDGRVGYTTSSDCWCLEADGSAFKPKPDTMPATSPVCK